MIELLQGDARHIPLVSGSVQCVITSPPYFGLRDYGISNWIGGDPTCQHKQNRRNGRSSSTLIGGQRGNNHDQEPYWLVCGKCGAVRLDPELGLEDSPDDYVAALIQVFQEIWRVLRSDGTVWLVLGDSYAESGNGGGGKQNSNRGSLQLKGQQKKVPNGYKPKDLLGIPWRVAFALQEDGWWLRRDIIWFKPNPMPESVDDRPTSAHEYVFLLAKSRRYYYDQDAIREPFVDDRKGYDGRKLKRIRNVGGRTDGYTTVNGWNNPNRNPGRNKRSVWIIPPEPYYGAHFATYPTALVDICILAGSRPGDLVLDPFCGSGTTGVMALKRERYFVGIDIKLDYIGMAQERIEKSRLPLFEKMQI